MALVAVRYVGPHDVVSLPVLGVDVPRGEVIKVTPAVAGRAPGGDDDDLGEGLLAQPDNWVPADVSAPDETREG